VRSEIAGDELPRRLKELVDSDRYSLVSQKVNKDGSSETFKFRTKGTENWPGVKRSVIDQDTGKEFFNTRSWYNPEIAELKPFRDKWGDSPNITLKDGWYKDVPAEKQDGVIFRGMSAEEYAEIQKTGSIKSSGEWNLGGQEGMTLYTTDPGSAQSYANSFAPAQFKATPEKPAYIIAIKDPGAKSGIPGTPMSATHERAVLGSVDSDEIISVYEGVPYLDHGVETDVVLDFSGIHDGSGSLSGSTVAWRKVK
jgi:hypothetical protein